MHGAVNTLNEGPSHNPIMVKKAPSVRKVQKPIVASNTSTSMGPRRTRQSRSPPSN